MLTPCWKNLRISEASLGILGKSSSALINLSSPRKRQNLPTFLQGVYLKRLYIRFQFSLISLITWNVL